MVTYLKTILLWGEFCCLLLNDVHEKFHKDILVPMTLVRKKSYRIIEILLRDGIDTHLVVLEASYQTVYDRILARGEKEGCWCMQNIDLARSGCAALPGIHIRWMERPWTNCAILYLTSFLTDKR